MADDFYHPNPSYHSEHYNAGHNSESVNTTIGPGQILIFSFIILLFAGAFTFYFFYLKPLNEQGFKCISVSDCDDDNACTIDKCSQKTGICYHPEKDCARGEFCNQDIGECELIVESKEITQTDTQTTTCVSSWGNCTSWSSCVNGNQTRICTDLNSCNSVSGNMKNETRTCTITQTGTQSSGGIPPPPPLPS